MRSFLFQDHKNMQNTNHLLLIKPAHFTFNKETAGSNAFQNVLNEEEVAIKQKVLKEFENVITTLQLNGMEVTVIEDTPTPVKPDAIFPNNWGSYHADGTIVLYPMFASNRRLERRKDIIDLLREKFQVKQVIDLSAYEVENKFLEGTGSIVFDHINKTAYACLSPRTDKELFIELSRQLGYKPVYFIAEDEHGKQIYHTNVMMCIAEKFAVICLASITDAFEKKKVVQSLQQNGHEIIDISFEQMNKFAGNMLEIKNRNGKHLLAMSKSAYDSLSVVQLNLIRKSCEPLSLPIQTIETIGGGSARCMMAEVFLTAK